MQFGQGHEICLSIECSHVCQTWVSTNTNTVPKSCPYIEEHPLFPTVPSISPSEGPNASNGGPQEMRSVVYEEYGFDILPVKRGDQMESDGVPFIAIRRSERTEREAPCWS